MPEIELNGVGRARVLEIQMMLQDVLREHFKRDDVSKYDALILDASVAMLKIEQVVAEEQTKLVEALKSLCETQDLVETSIRENTVPRIVTPSKVQDFMDKLMKGGS